MESKETYLSILAKLFKKWSGQEPEKIIPIAAAGSNRQYFRLSGQGQTAIGTYGAEPKENEAFVYLSRHFKSKGLPVPEIYAVDLDRKVYLQEDLGDTALFDLLPHKGEPFSGNLKGLYEKSVAQLARMQVLGGEGLDYNRCYPRGAFDRQSIQWDLNYFKYYFLKLLDLPFDEQALEEDFQKFADYLLEADGDYFMFRDFQSRNILIRNGEPWFIDYQGGRKGALQYDLASLLFQAKARLAADLREHLLEHYLREVQKIVSVDPGSFTTYYYAFVLVRCLQVLGAYGYRGLYEKKPHFLESIPFALKNLQWLLQNKKPDLNLPELWPLLEKVAQTDRFTTFDRQKGAASPLVVSVNSFSYKYGMPADASGNGGGFVFDCRCLHNPGRYEAYKKMTGLEKPVIDFLETQSNIREFLQNCYAVIDEALVNYIERGFSSLVINFGCTGGQHRSVYSAERMKEYLEKKYGVKVVLRHVEGERGNWIN